MPNVNNKRRQQVTTKPILVIGAGAWGTALALALARNQQSVHWWGNSAEQMQTMANTRHNPDFLSDISLPDNIIVHADLSVAINMVDDVLLVVPSSAVVSVLQQLRAYATPSRRIILASKGLYQGQLQHDLVQQIAGDIPVAALSGPTFAREVAEGLPAAIMLATTDKALCRDWSQRLHSRYFRVYHTQDIVGVELAGAIKNIFAIATGICDGMRLGANARCALITRGLAEMVRLGVALGAQSDTFMSLAGIGDLMLTCTDDQSRNRRFGLALGSGKSIAQARDNIGGVIEGEKAASEIYQLAKNHHIDMPIVTQVYALLQAEITPQQAADNLLARKA